MFKLTELIPKYAMKLKDYNLRDRREFYPSEALACPRDVYWKFIGEPETDPTDFIGKSRMMFGSALENAVKSEWLDKFGLYGLHLLGTQVRVGGSKPDWNGYVDFYVAAQVNNKLVPKVVEFKTKWGKGASFLWANLEPSQEYLVQLGLYLKCFHEKGKTREGCLLYFLIADDPDVFGQLVQFDCVYDPEDISVTCYGYSTSDGREGSCNIKVDLKLVLDNWLELEHNIKESITPKPGFFYKYPLTVDFLAKQSDKTIRDCLTGSKVIGDWQVQYSRYKTKAAKIDGYSLGYTAQEMQVLEDEYMRRHPKSKIKEKMAS